MNVASFNIWQWVVLWACPHRPQGNTTVGRKWEAWSAVIPTICGTSLWCFSVSYCAGWCSCKTLDLHLCLCLFICFSSPSPPPFLFFSFYFVLFYPPRFLQFNALLHFILWNSSCCGISNQNWHMYCHQPQQSFISFVNICYMFRLCWPSSGI
jgi:hypothetical protein